MKTNRFTALPAVLIACILSTACASGGGSGTPGMAPAGDPGDAIPAARPATGASLDELEALYAARQAAELEDVSDADVAFMTGMIGHHAQALVMSAMAPDNGASQTIRTLAGRITNAQKDEIRNMQRWLRDRGRPVPEVSESGRVTMRGDGMAGHADHGALMDHDGMPGMLSPAQLDELSRARGADFDRLFLAYMIQHHQGAVVMVRELFDTDGAVRDDTIFKIASDIQVDQVTEINRMQLMLDAMNAGDGDSPLNQD